MSSDTASDTSFDFDHWARLAREDPAAFERARESAVAEVIASAPEPMRRRLTGLQWQVDQVRAQASSPMGASLRLSQLMWERVAGDSGLLDALEDLGRASVGEPPVRREATILSLDAARRRTDGGD